VTFNKVSMTMTEQTGYKYTDTNKVRGNSCVRQSVMRQTRMMGNKCRTL